MTEHKSTDELELLVFLEVALVGLCKSLPVGKKNLVLTSVCFFTLPFKSLFVFLKDLNIIRDIEAFVVFIFTTINFLKHKNSPFASIVIDSLEINLKKDHKNQKLHLKCMYKFGLSDYIFSNHLPNERK